MQSRKNHLHHLPKVSLDHISSFLQDYEYKNLKKTSKEFFEDSSSVLTINSLCAPKAILLYNKTLLFKFRPGYRDLTEPLLTMAGAHTIRSPEDVDGDYLDNFIPIKTLPTMGCNIAKGFCCAFTPYCAPCGAFVLINSLISSTLAGCAYTTRAIQYTCCDPRNHIDPVKIAKPYKARLMIFNSQNPEKQTMQDEDESITYSRKNTK